MLTKDSSFRLKQLDSDGAGSFSRFGRVYNVEDLGGDTMVPGAFTKTLQSNGGKLPLPRQHRSDEPIGTVTASDSNHADGPPDSAESLSAAESEKVQLKRLLVSAVDLEATR
jgi:hypothetical protein